jgi:hypothetical protein
MGFLPAEMSYEKRSVTVFHDFHPHCKDQPWKIKTVSCLPHDTYTKLHGLPNDRWSLSNYNPTETGFSAELQVRELVRTVPIDEHLYQRFQRSGQLSIYIMFKDGPNSGYLTLDLRP